VSLNKALSVDARTRIIEAAGEIFAENGFARATIRSICSRAGVNIALVSYHFGDKEGLYLEVMKHYRTKALEEYPFDLGIDDSSSAEEKLHVFIRSLMFRLLGQGRPSCFWKLFAREFIEPTKAFDVMVKETIEPSYNHLMNIVRGLIGTEQDELTLRLCTASIVGQCLYYRNSREVISKIIGKDHFNMAEVEGIAEHITQFSLAAMRSCYGQRNQSALNNNNPSDSKRRAHQKQH
jgi:TetR/AcrR family transcriptional regulator, regulator of cefoperazone and chloramphenicol sensitivity